MKAWDTHFLVRHLTEDDPAQLKTVRRALADAERSRALVWIADVTLVETFWVLQHGYQLDVGSVVEILLRLADDARFFFQSGGNLRLALERVRIKGDLPEHLIALAARREGAEKTQTFDRDLTRFSEFEVF